MIVKEVLDKTTTFFREKKVDSPRLDSELLISAALGLKRIDLYLKFDQPLKENEVQTCRDFVRRRAQGEPVAYILGKKDFFGHTFLVNNHVLIPRPETESLVELAIQYIREQNMKNPQVIDLGCGSGCIGLSLKKNSIDVELTLLDVSEEALNVARENAESLQISEGVKFVCDNAMQWLVPESYYDVVLANPPYISPEDPELEKNVKLFEPHQALFSGQMGLGDIFGWSERYAPALRSGGLMLFEIGYKQGPQAVQHFLNLGCFSEVKLIKDLAQLDRIIMAIKK